LEGDTADHSINRLETRPSSTQEGQAEPVMVPLDGQAEEEETLAGRDPEPLGEEAQDASDQDNGDPAPQVDAPGLHQTESMRSVPQPLVTVLGQTAEPVEPAPAAATTPETSHDADEPSEEAPLTAFSPLVEEADLRVGDEAVGAVDAARHTEQVLSDATAGSGALPPLAPFTAATAEAAPTLLVATPPAHTSATPSASTGPDAAKPRASSLSSLANAPKLGQRGSAVANTAAERSAVVTGEQPSVPLKYGCRGVGRWGCVSSRQGQGRGNTCCSPAAYGGLTVDVVQADAAPR
jgi:hypothetical protein